MADRAAPYTGAFLFLGAFGLYLGTLAPTVTFWDSGELITAACALGIPHQPGYPLFSVTGRLFAFIPLGNAAYRVNLLSAVFSALTVYVVYRAAVAVVSGSGTEAARRTAPATAAAPLAMMLAVSGVFWPQAVVTEVYALNGFFVASLLYMHVAAVAGGLAPMRYVALSGFVFGLGAVNHVSMALYFPSLVMSWAVTAGVRIGVRGYILAAFFALLGLSAYMYLPVRSATGPALDIGDPAVWPEFLRTVMWGEYLERAGGLARSAISLPARLDAGDWRVAAGVPAALAAGWLLVRENPRLFLPPSAYLALYVAVVSAQVLGSERDIRFGLPPKFFIPALICAAVLAGGVIRPIVRASGRAGKWLLYAAAAALIATALVAGHRNMYRADMSENFIAFDYSQNSLKSVGESGVLLTWGDNGVFPLWYLNIVERYRDDAVLVHTPLMTYGWYLEDVRRRMDKDLSFMSPYFLGENAYRLMKAAAASGRPFCYDYSATRFLKLDEKTLGLRGLVYYEGGTPPGDPWSYYVFRGVDDPDVHKGPMEKNIVEIYRHQARLSARLPAVLFKRP